jgi:hypothetical protein
LLVEPLPNRRIYNDGDWYLACRKEKAHAEKILLFRSWILTQISADDTMPVASPAVSGQSAARSLARSA